MISNRCHSLVSSVTLSLAFLKVFYYSTDILLKSGISNVENYTPLIGLTMVLMTIVSIPLMEKAGRRFLHLVGLAGMFVASIVLTVALTLQVSS
jgi:SP family facilitated glucose transporter-like MFS transporter 1